MNQLKKEMAATYITQKNDLKRVQKESSQTKCRFKPTKVSLCCHVDLIKSRISRVRDTTQQQTSMQFFVVRCRLATLLLPRLSSRSSRRFAVAAVCSC